jgi:hypothetical protein
MVGMLQLEADFARRAYQVPLVLSAVVCRRWLKYGKVEVTVRKEVEIMLPFLPHGQPWDRIFSLNVSADGKLRQLSVGMCKIVM